MDPGVVPPELEGLTQVEQMLISAVLPMMAIYHLPHGQLGYRGHIINLPQDVSGFASSLPRIPNELDVIIVRKKTDAGLHRDFHVRRSRVLGALQWLKNNNIYYENIAINNDAVAMLPEHGQLPEIPVITTDTAVGQCNSEQIDTDSDDPYNAHLTGTFVPVNHRKLTEEETVRQSVTERQQHTTAVPWPHIGDQPVNEFHAEGYFTCAFPTLFPTGKADFSAPRQRTVTIGRYLKHLMLYKDGRFARHSRFRYFALNTEMRWRALQAGRIYVRQNPQDARLSVPELRDMIGCGGAAFSSRVMHFATSLRGTQPYWFKQRTRLIAMVDTLGLPSVFFTHSAADTQWPELADLTCPEESNSRAARSRSLIENPAIADWLFYHRITSFVRSFYVDVLGAQDYWLRFEWQHRGSPHVHGLAWFHDAPDVQRIFNNPTTPDSLKQEAIQYINSVVTTVNPSISLDGSNPEDALPPQTDPHVCNKRYDEVQDKQQDLAELVATCQRHTRCSASYCLRTKQGKQQCRFGYPKQLQTLTEIANDSGELSLTTARNDCLINSFNPIQLSTWRANVDLQYCVSRRRVVEYCAKYATKSEPRSKHLKEVYSTIVRGLQDEDKPIKAVQKLLINTVGERDYSAQETCHLLLELPMYTASRDFIIVSVDGTRMVQDHLDEQQPATVASPLDHYLGRPTTPQFESLPFLLFVQQYRMPKEEGAQPLRRSKAVVVIVRPHYPPDPDGPHFEKYCRQKLMLHKPFRNEQQLLTGVTSYTAAYTEYLQSVNVPPSLQDDVHRLEHQLHLATEDTDSDHEQDNDHDEHQLPHRATDEWMLLCRLRPQLSNPDQHHTHTNTVWTAASHHYPNLEETASFISRNRQTAEIQPFVSTANADQLHGKQLQVYQTVLQHFHHQHPNPLRMIVCGTAGTGKSYLIHCIRKLLLHRVRVVAPTGVAAFNVAGQTLHSLLDLPTKGEFKDLEGDRLQHLQQRLSQVTYLIIDEISMVGRKLFGQVDRRLRQAFPNAADDVLGNCSCLLFGDFGQLSPVMDLPLYTTVSRSQLSDLGRAAYQLFDKAVVLDQVLRQRGNDPTQVRFREVLSHLRDGSVTTADWEYLMTRTIARAHNVGQFSDAPRLYPTVEAVIEHNAKKLHDSGQPVAQIKAIHTGPNAAKAPPDDAAGLEPIICLAHGARVMLTSNLWVDAGLVNGAMGTVVHICYLSGGPPNLPLSVMIKFDHYSGPTLANGTVPIIPLRRTWITAGSTCSRLQLPLKLAWAVTIHKAQGLTLNKAIINNGSKEFSTGLTFVACSRVRNISDLLFDTPFSFQRLANLGRSQRLKERQQEDARLKHMANSVALMTPSILENHSPSRFPSPPALLPLDHNHLSHSLVMNEISNSPLDTPLQPPDQDVYRSSDLDIRRTPSPIPATDMLHVPTPSLPDTLPLHPDHMCHTPSLPPVLHMCDTLPLPPDLDMCVTLSLPPEHMCRTPSPPPELMCRTPSPPPEHMCRTPSPPPEHMCRTPSPPPEHMCRTPSPHSEHMCRTPSLPPEHMCRTPSPPPEHMCRTPSPHSEHMCRTPSPPPEHMCRTPSPPPEHMCRTPSPHSEHMCRTSSPPPEHMCRSPSQPPYHMCRTPSPPPDHDMCHTPSPPEMYMYHILSPPPCITNLRQQEPEEVIHIYYAFFYT